MFHLPTLAIVVVMALASTLFPSTAFAAAANNRDFRNAGPHQAAMEALEEAGILAGTECETAGYCPDDPLPRWVMAVWLVRALQDEKPADDGSAIFADIEIDAWWAPYVQRLFELGITRGCAVEPARFCPDQPVTRGQMASFLNRAFKLAPVLELQPEELFGFTDTVNNYHALSIEALAASGITIGCSTSPLRYCPQRVVTTGEMSTFVARALWLVPSIPSVQDPAGEGRLHLVSEFTTHHPCCAPRVQNIHLFAETVDGALVRPGQQFSLNGHVGQRTSKRVTWRGARCSMVRWWIRWEGA